MENKLFREKSIESISSPDKLDDYIHVIGPGVWMTLLIIILLIVSGFIWASLGTVRVWDSYDCIVGDDSKINIVVDSTVAEGIGNDEYEVYVEETKYDNITITQDPVDNSKYIVGIETTDIQNGLYEVRFVRNVKPIRYLFN